MKTTSNRMHINLEQKNITNQVAYSIMSSFLEITTHNEHFFGNNNALLTWRVHLGYGKQE